MRTLFNTMRQLRKNEDGAALVEYAVLLGILLAVTVATFTAIGGSVNTIFTNVQSAMAAAAG
jgi:pilus assembly protein Flp/PilA